MMMALLPSRSVDAAYSLNTSYSNFIITFKSDGTYFMDVDLRFSDPLPEGIYYITFSGLAHGVPSNLSASTFSPITQRYPAGGNSPVLSFSFLFRDFNHLTAGEAQFGGYYILVSDGSISASLFTVTGLYNQPYFDYSTSVSIPSIYVIPFPSISLDGLSATVSAPVIEDILSTSPPVSGELSSKNDEFSSAMDEYDSTTDTTKQYGAIKDSGLLDFDVSTTFTQMASTITFFSSMVSGMLSSFGDFNIPLTLFLTLVLVSAILSIGSHVTSDSYTGTRNKKDKGG